MFAKKLKINIAHLYPKLLNIYGDRGNILTLVNRCKWRNIDVLVDEIDTGNNIDPEKYDIYFIGGGQDQQQIQVAEELQLRKASLHDAAEKNAVFLAICGGYQLLGHYYQPNDAKRLEGIGILDAYTIAGSKRFIGNVTAQLLPENLSCEIKTLVGFENHSGLTYLQGNTRPIAKIITGNGNNGTDGTEGGRYKNVFGTYLHGSLLPKNPHFADFLISLALEKRYEEKIELQKLNDELELAAHNSLINKKY